MSTLTTNQIDRAIQEDNIQKSSKEALSHLEEVIASVISDAVDYAEKPPEERTLPLLVRKSNTQARLRPPFNSYNKSNISFEINNGSHILGSNRMPTFSQRYTQLPNAAATGQHFPDKSLSSQASNMLQISSMQSGGVQQANHLFNQYNGLQPNQCQIQNAHMQQQYAQAAHHFQLQAQSQYQSNAAAAFTQMHLHQQHQNQRQQQVVPGTGHSLIFAATSSAHGGTPSFSLLPTEAGSPSCSVSGSSNQQQQALVAASAQQQLHQLSTAYAAAHQLPGMMQTFSPTPEQRWANVTSTVGNYHTTAPLDQQRQQEQFNPATLLHHQQQYLQQRSQQSTPTVSDLARYAAYQQQ